MRPFIALVRVLAVTAVLATACTSQAVIERADADPVNQAMAADDAATGEQVETTTTADDVAADEGKDSNDPTEVTTPIPAGWIGVPGQSESPAEADFVSMIDTLANAPGLRTTVTTLSNQFGSVPSYSEVRESNRDEPGGTYTTDWSATKILAADLVWTIDRDRPNLYVGVDAREKDAALTNSHLLKNIQGSIVDVAGFEQDPDGSSRWYLLADPTEFMVPIDDWNSTGTAFDRALVIAEVAPSGELTSMEMDLNAATYARTINDRISRLPNLLHFEFETFDSRLPLGPPCDDPTAATDDRSRSVLHCPVDSEGFIAPHVSIGYFEDPAASSQAFLVGNLLGELGYSVEVVGLSDGVDAAYDALAANTIDLYASGWFPVDEGQLSRISPDGEIASRFDDALVPGASVSSLVVSTEWAETANISSIDDINSDPALFSALDSDGNGKGEIEGCPVGHPCRPWLEDQIESAWRNLELTNRSYQAAFSDLFLAKVLGQPALAVATLPDPRFSNYFGDWSVVSVPDGIEGIGEQAFGSGCEDASDVCRPGPLCRSVSELCRPVFAQADLEVVARVEWIAANPAGAALVEQITIDADWLHAVADDASFEDSDTSEFRVDAYGADSAADGWMSSRGTLIAGWINAALAVDPTFGIQESEAEEVQVVPATPEPGTTGVSPVRPPRREGDLLAWEQAVLTAVQQSGAAERADSTELLSLGAGAVCDQAVDAEAMMQLFDASREQFVDLDAQTGPFLDLIHACDLKPGPSFSRVGAGVDAAVLPTGVGDWDEFVAHVQQSGVAWGSFDDVEIMAARSCIGSSPRLADYANGYSIGAGMLSVSQMQALASLLDAGCALGTDQQWRALVLYDTGRDSLRQIFGQSAVEIMTDAEFDCMVNTAAALGRPPASVDPVAAMAPVCAPAVVIEGDTLRYTSDLVSEPEARCVAEGLVGLASSTRDASMYFGRWLSPVLSGQQAVVDQIVRERCGLTDAQVEDLNIFGL